MKIKKIELKNYRNYDNLKINFIDNLNIIIGNNAQGKTNLLESIYVLAVTKSFLSINDKNLIKFNSKYSTIKGLIESGSGTSNLNILFNENGKIVKVNQKEIKKLSDYISFMNVIIFSSDNIRLFKDSPSLRRKYFNTQISQVNKNYLNILNDYNKILKQRNEFLKIINVNKKNDLDYLDVLNEKYVSLAIKVIEYRKDYIDRINKYIGSIFNSIFDIKGLEIKYLPNVDSSENFNEYFINKLKNNLNKEILYKMTLFGPNRDDFCLFLDDKNILLYGSQGQIRSSILALKLSEVNIFYNISNEYPILLLDDIFSELDIEKRNKVIKYLNKNIQTIISTTDLENIDKEIRKNANVYQIENGKIISREINN